PLLAHVRLQLRQHTREDRTKRHVHEPSKPPRAHPERKLRGEPGAAGHWLEHERPLETPAPVSPEPAWYDLASAQPKAVHPLVEALLDVQSRADLQVVSTLVPARHVRRMPRSIVDGELVEPAPDAIGRNVDQYRVA